MVKTVTGEIHVCEVCEKPHLDKKEAEEHEKHPIQPKYMKGEDVKGHYLIAKVDGVDYVFTAFKVLDIKKEKHSFVYHLEPNFIEAYHSRSECYTSPCIFKKGSKWDTAHKDDKAILDSLEGKLSDIPLSSLTIHLSEDRISPQLRFGRQSHKN